MESTMSLLGLYKYDNTVLDGLHIPEGLDSEVLKDNLLMETAELEVLYSSASFMKSAIEVWSQKMLDICPTNTAHQLFAQSIEIGRASCRERV